MLAVPPTKNFAVERFGVLMSPQGDQPYEAWGVLNPGGIRTPDGMMHLFPRLIAEGNYSRIGHARVRYDGDIPVGVDRLGIALEPRDDRGIVDKDQVVVLKREPRMGEVARTGPQPFSVDGIGLQVHQHAAPFYAREAQNAAAHRVVCDCIAGMTDQFLLRLQPGDGRPTLSPGRYDFSYFCEC